MKLSACSLCVCVLLLLLFCGLTSCHKPKPYKIAFLGGLTGPVADLGVRGRDSVMLAVEEINRQGGVNGRPVELIVRDDQQNPEKAQELVRELAALEVEAVVGPMTSNIATAIQPLLDQYRLVAVSPTVTTTRLSGKDDYFFRIISTTAEYAAQNARYLFERGGRRAAAVLYEEGNADYAADWHRHFAATFRELGGAIVTARGYRSGERNDFQALAAELLASRPDMVLVVTHAVDAALLAQQIRRLAPEMTISLAEWASTEKLIELGGSAVEGAYVSQFMDRNDRSERYRRFVQNYTARFGQEPGFAGLAGYDAAALVLHALSRTRSPGTLKETMQTLREFQGVQQTVLLDRYGDSSRRITISVVRNGQYRSLE